MNGGTCVNLNQTSEKNTFGFACQCQPGFAGELCEQSKVWTKKYLKLEGKKLNLFTIIAIKVIFINKFVKN